MQDTLIAQRLRELREKSGKSQDAVAEACGITRVTLARYENASRIPKIKIAADLARYYGVPTDYLTGNDEQQETAFPNPKQQQILSELEKLSEDQLEEVLRYAEYVKQKK